MMARVAVIIADLFEDSEYTEPADAFRKAGHEVIHVGLLEGQTVHGKKKNTAVSIDLAVRDVRAADFDALLIPGGYSPDKLRADSHAVEFVRQFMEKNKPVFSICHGPQLLITARSLEGRKVTGWKSIRQDIIYAGARFIDEEMVEDGNLITSRSPGDLPAFIRACLAKLAGN
ncbi:MAG: type 1 glutamine amidotransferase [Desulfobulbaceae bacterium]|nr:type 1 glutamine amidotransferase [Desulfobulbaceae bacterium]